jgi:hypothetical protein
VYSASTEASGRFRKDDDDDDAAAGAAFDGAPSLCGAAVGRMSSIIDAAQCWGKPSMVLSAHRRRRNSSRALHTVRERERRDSAVLAGVGAPHSLTQASTHTHTLEHAHRTMSSPPPMSSPPRPPPIRVRRKKQKQSSPLLQPSSPASYFEQGDDFLPASFSLASLAPPPPIPVAEPQLVALTRFTEQVTKQFARATAGFGREIAVYDEREKDWAKATPTELAHQWHGRMARSQFLKQYAEDLDAPLKGDKLAEAIGAWDSLSEDADGQSVKQECLLQALGERVSVSEQLYGHAVECCTVLRHAFSPCGLERGSALLEGLISIVMNWCAPEPFPFAFFVLLSEFVTSRLRTAVALAHGVGAIEAATHIKLNQDLEELWKLYDRRLRRAATHVKRFAASLEVQLGAMSLSDLHAFASTCFVIGPSSSPVLHPFHQMLYELADAGLVKLVRTLVKHDVWKSLDNQACPVRAAVHSPLMLAVSGIQNNSTLRTCLEQQDASLHRTWVEANLLKASAQVLQGVPFHSHLCRLVVSFVQSA